MLFIDEFDMRRRHDEERGCAPDYAVLSKGRLWSIELKTEKASHRRDQIPSYFEFGRHYYPDRALDITYLTPPMTLALTPPGSWARFAHADWDSVAAVVRQIWGDSDVPTERNLLNALVDSLERLAIEKPVEWRARLRGIPVERPQPDVEGVPITTVGDAAEMPNEDAVSEAYRLAELTAGDHQQRALCQWTHASSFG